MINIHGSIYCFKFYDCLISVRNVVRLIRISRIGSDRIFVVNKCYGYVFFFDGYSLCSRICCISAYFFCIQKLRCSRFQILNIVIFRKHCAALFSICKYMCYMNVIYILNVYRYFRCHRCLTLTLCNCRIGDRVAAVFFYNRVLCCDRCFFSRCKCI